MSPNGTPVLQSFWAYCFEEELEEANHSGDGIVVLGEDEATEAWVERFGRGNTCYFDLPEGSSWIDRAKWSRVGDWDEDVVATARLLASCVDWPPETVVLYFCNHVKILRVSWGLFLEFWWCFLCAHDECPILLPEEDALPNALMFTPGGDIIKLVGPRK